MAACAVGSAAVVSCGISWLATVKANRPASMVEQ